MDYMTVVRRQSVRFRAILVRHCRRPRGRRSRHLTGCVPWEEGVRLLLELHQNMKAPMRSLTTDISALRTVLPCLCRITNPSVQDL